MSLFGTYVDLKGTTPNFHDLRDKIVKRFPNYEVATNDEKKTIRLKRGIRFGAIITLLEEEEKIYVKAVYGNTFAYLFLYMITFRLIMFSTMPELSKISKEIHQYLIDIYG